MESFAVLMVLILSIFKLLFRAWQHRIRFEKSPKPVGPLTSNCQNHPRTFYYQQKRTERKTTKIISYICTCDLGFLLRNPWTWKFHFLLFLLLNTTVSCWCPIIQNIRLKTDTCQAHTSYTLYKHPARKWIHLWWITSDTCHSHSFESTTQESRSQVTQFANLELYGIKSKTIVVA